MTVNMYASTVPGMDMSTVLRRHQGPTTRRPTTARYDPPSHSSTRPSTASASRVRCPAAPGGVETNAAGSTAVNWKPKALCGSTRGACALRRSATLNQSGVSYDGAVLRARMKYVGPTYPVPSATDATNAATGVGSEHRPVRAEPDSSDANAIQHPPTPRRRRSSTVAWPTIWSNSGADHHRRSGYRGNDPVRASCTTRRSCYRNVGAEPGSGTRC